MFSEVLAQQAETEMRKDTIAFLRSARPIQIRIRSIKARLATLKDLAQSITPQMSEAPGGSKGRNSDRVGEVASAIADLESELSEEILDFFRVTNTINAAINAFVQDELSRSIFKARYVNCGTWDAVAVECYVSRRWAQTLHDRALPELRENGSHPSL